MDTQSEEGQITGWLNYSLISLLAEMEALDYLSNEKKRRRGFCPEAGHYSCGWSGYYY